MIQNVEALVVGAGVIGSSVAMHLAKKGMKDVRVIDFDLEGGLSSSELNAGGVRATWVQPINIEMSKISIEYFSKVAEEIGYRPCGYLWLHPQERLDKALKARERQIQRGWPVEVWDVPELKRRVPFLNKTEGIAGAIFAPRDGLVNPNLLKNHFRSEGKAAGVVYEDRTLLRQVNSDSEKKFKVVAERFPSILSEERKLKVLASESQADAEKITDRELETKKVEYVTDRVINCAGPWAAQVAKRMGYSTPAFPVRRQISIFDCKDVDLTPYGMIVDTSGVYFHPEASQGLAGFASPGEPKGINYHYDGESFFMETLWPALYERSTFFERLKHVTGWAGIYEVSPDECAILGAVDNAGLPGFYEAHSFSGHGVMHSYCAGLLLAEKIIDGDYQTLDANLLSASRFEKQQWIRESLII